MSYGELAKKNNHLWVHEEREEEGAEEAGFESRAKRMFLSKEGKGHSKMLGTRPGMKSTCQIWEN